MIEIMKDFPDNVLAITAKGQVTGDDYENVIIPAVEAKLKEYSKIRLLYHLGPDFSGYNAIALWDDAKVGLKHLTHFDRIAIVTDTEWIATAMKVFGFMMPGEVRCFDNDQLAEAGTWIGK